MENLERILGFFYLPLLQQSLLLAAALVVLLGIRKTDTVRISRLAIPLIIFLFVRDILAAFWGHPLIALSSDAAPAIFVAVIFLLEKKNKLHILILAVFSILFSGVLALAIGALLGDFLLRLLVLILPAGAIALIVFIDRRESDHRNTLFGLISFGLALFISPISALFPLTEQFRQGIAVPLSYLAFIFGLLDYWRVLQDNLLKDRDYQSDTIDTLYGFVSRASDTISSGADIQSLMGYVAQTLCTETSSDGALVLMVDDFEDKVVCRAHYGESDPLLPLPDDIPQERESVQRWFNNLSIPLSEGLIGEIIQGGKAYFIPDCLLNPSITVAEGLPAGSAIISPFVINDRVIGMSILTRHASSRPFRDEDFDRASLMADFASLVINNVYSFQDVTERTDIDTAAAIAADIQKTVTPRKIKDLPLANFGFISKPARGVCGDYFDVIPARNDRVYLVMCDVAGKGVPASLIMVMIRAILYLVTNTKQDASTILNWVNRGITGKVDLDHFATLQILIYNPQTGECEYANAGHRPPLIWKNKDGIVDAVEIHSVPIGVEKAHDFKSTHFTLDNDDIVVLYTDGVVETMNGAGRQFGIRNLTTILHKSHDLSAKDLVSRIDREISEFAGSVRQHDDQTLLAMKVKR